MKTHKEIYEALASGETLLHEGSIREIRLLDNGMLNHIRTFSNPEKYRIKPKPLEFWVDIYDADGKTIISESDVTLCCNRSQNYERIKLIKAIKVREVLDENI